ncbi:uncharacterized protein, partial [Euwallacea fornicatus]|uniref:uncharacterized protein n=1 Tax=Euwallacea fornicatus TaxID=995702 RepID=UPI00338FC1F4
RNCNVVGGVGGLQPPSRPGAAITDHHGDRHRCPEDGPRASGCEGGRCAASGGGGATPVPPTRAPSTATLRSNGGAVSERYPLGKDRQSSVAATTAHHKSQSPGYHHQDRFLYNDRPASSASTGSTARYSVSSNSSADRYPHGSLERYHTSTSSYPRTPTPSSERFHTLDKKYHMEAVEAAPQVTCTLDRSGCVMVNPSGSTDFVNCRYTPTERHRRNSKSDVYKIRERSTSSDRKERIQREHLQGRVSQYDTTSQYERPTTPSILACPPAPAPFGGPSAASEPPSPAPACDRFVAPPPAEGEPETTDCYAHGAFPSPVAPAAQERFVPPPLPAPSPTEDRPGSKQRFQQEKYHYPSPNQSSDRFYQYTGNKQDRYHLPGNASPTTVGYYQAVNNGEQRFGEAQRYIPPNAHMPVERYVPQPQPQEPFYSSYQATYERYPKPFPGSDPYMRRDLNYHYRLPVQFPQNQFQKIRYSHLGTPSRVKCCPFDGPPPGGTRSSSGSTSSASSVASTGHASSLQDVQCQNYQSAAGHHFQQEKGTQCPITPTPVTITSRTPTSMVSCRHGGCEGTIEYVGASGGRRICATPPPRPQDRCEGCIQAAAQAVAVAVQLSAQKVGTMGRQGQQTQTWRSPTPNSQTPSTQQHDQSAAIQLTPRHVQTNRSITPTNQRSLTPTTMLSSSGTEQSALSSASTGEDTPLRLRQNMQSHPSTPASVLTASNLQVAPTIAQSTAQATPSANRSAVHRTVSLPSTPADPTTAEGPRGEGPERIGATKRVNYTQSERVPNRVRPPLHRSVSRKEMIKNYIKKETANFFGVGEENEKEEKQRWLDRRKRMASRTMGPLKDQYATLSYRPQSTLSASTRPRRAASEVTPSVAEVTAGGSYSGQMMAGRPDVLPGELDVADGTERLGTSLRRKDSVARMTWNGLNYVVTTLTRHRPRPRSRQTSWSRSFPPEVPQTSTHVHLPSPEEEAEAFFEKSDRPPSIQGDTVDRSERVRAIDPGIREQDRYSAVVPGARWQQEGVVLRHPERRAVLGQSRITSNILANTMDNSNRRQYGMGWIGRFFRRSYRKSIVGDEHIQAQLDDMDDHRPYFTYWVTTVQILVLFISIICYGIGPFGVDLQAKSGQVLVTSLSLQQVDYMEPANFWGGPRAADLIHLGAKFAPCMRVDDKVTQQIEKTRKKERETACCIRNDDSGCVQSSQADCSVRGLRQTVSKTISTWKKWNPGEKGPGGRISGSVCGLDPNYCDAPASVHPYEWPDDITKWPICRKRNHQISNAVANRRDKSAPRDKIVEHMVCEVIGHPCCIGIHGQCRITTREYCDFVRGTFHEEASLCSQVSCLNDVCGMIPFYFPDVPDQIYRLWTSLFLHAGVLQLIITVMVQYFLMRDLEKLTGSLRIAIIYIGSGVAGNLASAIFVPYRADVGPAGSQFGLLACLIVEVLNAWPMLKHPNQALCKLLSITMVLFLIGLLPWVDNYAHLFGFIFGFLLSYALLPFVSFGYYDRHKKICLIWVCLLTALILFVILILLFYIIPVYDCKICSYFNCLPLTRDFCASQNINFKREEPIV